MISDKSKTNKKVDDMIQESVSESKVGETELFLENTIDK